jgi:prepilin-type N-terminal cleavage/methylation domain-containing protein
MKQILCRRKGFTLIEMLIVITIIALLASLILVGMGGARAKARDARRIADLRDVQNALELYYSSNSAYPDATTWSALATQLESVNVNKLPNDPNANDSYEYCPGTDNLSYTLAAQLETDDSALDNSASGSCGGITCGRTAKGYCLTP